MALDRGGGGGRGLAMGPLTARKIGARLEVGGLRFAEPLFEVYDAHDRRMNAVVGLRAALPQVITRRPLVERLQQHFKALGRIRHPQIVTIHEQIFDGPNYFISQELIEGPSLAEWIEARGARLMSCEEAFSIGCIVCAGLTAIHTERMCHGGVNPFGLRVAERFGVDDYQRPVSLRNGRLFLDNSIPVTLKLFDLGLPPMAGGIASTRKGYGLQEQSSEYISPEQMTGLAPNPRADFYTLACTLVFCMTGAPPASPSLAFSRKVDSAGDSLAALPDAAQNALQKALRRTSAERYANAEEMASALEAAIHYIQSHSRARTSPFPPPEPPPPEPPSPQAAGPRRPGSPVLTPLPVRPRTTRPITREEEPPTAPAPAPALPAAPEPLSPRAAAPPEPPSPGRPPREPSPRRGVLPRIERDPNWRPPLRASSLAQEREPVSSPIEPRPSEIHRPPSGHGIAMGLRLPELVLIPGGSYLRGSEDEEDASPRHLCIVDAFQIGRYPVTNEEYRQFILATGHAAPRSSTAQYAIWNGRDFPPELARHPVVHISWSDAAAFCDWLTQVTGKPHRLPTEAEWERAARGGLEGKIYPWGDDEPSAEHAVFDLLWTGPDSIPPVGTKPPNGFGLYDMAGLVWEWCQDFYHRRYYELPEVTEPNPLNEAPSLHKVMRGGAWSTGQRTLRCATRGKQRSDATTAAFGFRVAASA